MNQSDRENASDASGDTSTYLTAAPPNSTTLDMTMFHFCTNPELMTGPACFSDLN